MHGSNSGLAHGTAGSPQQTLGQETYKAKAQAAEAALARENFLRKELVKSCPMKVPKNAGINPQQKKGYKQVKYTWSRGKYRYEARWHTRTPGAPKEQGMTWVITRRIPGIGYGPQARLAVKHVYVGNAQRKGHWVTWERWQAAISANKNGKATKKQKEMLENGHWPAGDKVL